MVGISPKKLGSSSPKIAPRENRNEWAWPLAVVWLAALVYAAFLSWRPYAAPRALFDPFHALKLFLRFAIAKGVVTYGLELMMAIAMITAALIR